MQIFGEKNAKKMHFEKKKGDFSPLFPQLHTYEQSLRTH